MAQNKPLEIVHIPNHIAIIMDGNGRWAKRRLLPRTAGHRVGAKNIFAIADAAIENKVKVLSIFAFSTENWNRPQDEIDFLFGYLESEFNKRLPELMAKDIRIIFSGFPEPLPLSTQAVIKEAMAKTKDNQGLVLNICLNYGGRKDIVQAAKKIASEVQMGKINVDEVDENTFKAALLTDPLPDVDLLIRTSGEMRISNFMLYQMAYAEFYFTNTLWPDFKKGDFQKAILAYNKRDRRYGGIKNER